MVAVVAADDVLSALTANCRTMKAAKRSSPGSIAPGSTRVTLTGRRPPTLALDEDELAFALGERVTLVPAAGRAQRELAASPVKPPASAQVSRYELADDAAECVRGLHDALPKTGAGEVPAFSAPLCGRVAGEEALEAKGAGALEDIEAAVIWAAR